MQYSRLEGCIIGIWLVAAMASLGSHVCFGGQPATDTMLLPFAEVTKLSRAEAAVASFVGNLEVQAGMKTGVWKTPRRALTSLTSRRVATPDGKAAYDTWPGGISMYSQSGERICVIRLGDIGLDPNQYEIGNILGVATDRVFVSINAKAMYKGGKTTPSTGRIVEVAGCTEGVSVTTHMMELWVGTAAVNVEKRKVIMSIAVPYGMRVYDLDSGKLLTIVPDAYTEAYMSLAYWAGDGPAVVSCSKYSQDDTKVLVAWPEQSKRKFIDDGKLASLASDGLVYYLKGDTQLWRCKPEGTPEPVYLASRKTPDEMEAELFLGYDGQFIAFFYAIEGRQTDIAGLRHASTTGYVIMDLVAKEFMVVPVHIESHGRQK